MIKIDRPSKDELARSWVSPQQREDQLDGSVTTVRYVIPALAAEPRRVVEQHVPRGSAVIASVWFELEEGDR